MKKIALTASFVASYLWADGFTNTINMKFAEIPAGSFEMGAHIENCPKDDPFTKKDESYACTRHMLPNQKPKHTVSVPSFYIQTTEVTQLQYYTLLHHNPSAFQKEKLGYDSRNNPVESISWLDAQKFINALNKKEHTNSYALCSEEQWEYAARAKSNANYFYGNNESKLGQYAWFKGNVDRKTHPVGTKKPNSWGLYDMLGNVWELTGSCYRKSYDTKECKKGYATVRGGGWNNTPPNLYLSVRGKIRLDDPLNNIGFRVCKYKPTPKKVAKTPLTQKQNVKKH